MDLVLALLPLVLVVVLMTKPRGWSAPAALGMAAAIAWLVRLAHFASDPLLVHAAIIDGAISALTPLSIVAGAILLFRAMEAGGAIATMRAWLDRISPDPVAQLMIIGWAFAFLIEGASGFGTPAALAAPILVALGFAPLKAAIFCLVCNSVPTSFGAIGTPTWFGFGQLGLVDSELAAIGARTALLHTVAALVIPIVALRLVLSWSQIRPRLGFAYASIASCVLPYLVIAHFSYEFPSLVGGAIGLAASVALARLGLGLPPREPATTETRNSSSGPSAGAVVRAFTPLGLTVLVLVLTRIPQLGIKPFLVDASTWLGLSLGSLGTLTVSPGLVVNLEGILTTGTSADYRVLYTPALVPFVLVVMASAPLLGLGWRRLVHEAEATGRQLAGPALALIAALVFVRLMMMDGERSGTTLIGQGLASVAGSAWPLFAAYLGALGSFFSGSNTIANLTFGPIQATIAENLGIPRPAILALQSVGGAMGNMVCVHNIVAVCSVLSLSGAEGRILRATAGPVLLYGAIVGLVGLLLP